MTPDALTTSAAASVLAAERMRVQLERTAAQAAGLQRVAQAQAAMMAQTSAQIDTLVQAMRQARVPVTTYLKGADLGRLNSLLRDLDALRAPIDGTRVTALLGRARVRLASLDHRGTGLRQWHADLVNRALDSEVEAGALLALRALGGDRRALASLDPADPLCAEVLALFAAVEAHSVEVSRAAELVSALLADLDSETAHYRAQEHHRPRRPEHLGRLRGTVQRCAPPHRALCAVRPTEERTHAQGVHPPP